MKRLSILEVEINEAVTGETIYKGVLNDFVEGFVNDETYFYKLLQNKGLKSYPSIPVLWADNQTEIVVNF